MRESVHSIMHEVSDNQLIHSLITGRRVHGACAQETRFANVYVLWEEYIQPLVLSGFVACMFSTFLQFNHSLPKHFTVLRTVPFLS